VVDLPCCRLTTATSTICCLVRSLQRRWPMTIRWRPTSGVRKVHGLCCCYCRWPHLHSARAGCCCSWYSSHLCHNPPRRRSGKICGETRINRRNRRSRPVIPLMPRLCLMMRSGVPSHATSRVILPGVRRSSPTTGMRATYTTWAMHLRSRANSTLRLMHMSRCSKWSRTTKMQATTSIL